MIIKNGLSAIMTFSSQIRHGFNLTAGELKQTEGPLAEVLFQLNDAS